MMQLATCTIGWEFEVERGPDWLIIKIHPNGHSYYDNPEFADRIWQILTNHFVYRLVLEMDEVDILPSHLMGQLVMLQKRVLQNDGALRICHLRPRCQDALRLTRLDGILPNYDTLEDAIRARSVLKPR
ncbi:MAG: STAS domain-containing protein [Pirellulales bacterium]|nr:STAS domain-containing protein [Pirellulales bacterium]